MTINFHPYDHTKDYKRVSEFLIRHYQSNNRDGNWLEPAWEYIHFHPGLDSANLDKIGIWEDKDSLVGVVNYETELGEAFFQFHPDYQNLRDEMLDYAKKNLWGCSRKDGCKFLTAFVSSINHDFTALIKARGYKKKETHNRPMSKFTISNLFPEIILPEGYKLTNLAEECDWVKIHRAMWRGFNHPGEPPGSPEELKDRQKMFNTPKARLDLKIAVVDPKGDFVSFCGMFYEEVHHYAYVEPVATDPVYRRMGLGRAAVLEGIRRCGNLGATAAYVGSSQPFYLAIGFTVLHTGVCWVKYWN